MMNNHHDGAVVVMSDGEDEGEEEFEESQITTTATTKNKVLLKKKKSSLPSVRRYISSKGRYGTTTSVFCSNSGQDDDLHGPSWPFTATPCSTTTTTTREEEEQDAAEQNTKDCDDEDPPATRFWLLSSKLNRGSGVAVLGEDGLAPARVGGGEFVLMTKVLSNRVMADIYGEMLLGDNHRHRYPPTHQHPTLRKFETWASERWEIPLVRTSTLGSSSSGSGSSFDGSSSLCGDDGSCMMVHNGSTEFVVGGLDESCVVIVPIAAPPHEEGKGEEAAPAATSWNVNIRTTPELRNDDEEFDVRIQPGDVLVMKAGRPTEALEYLHRVSPTTNPGAETPNTASGGNAKDAAAATSSFSSSSPVILVFTLSASRGSGRRWVKEEQQHGNDGSVGADYVVRWWSAAEPNPPRTAFSFLCTDLCRRRQGKDSDCILEPEAIHQIGAVVARRRWEAMSTQDAAKYHALANQDQRRYNMEMTRYNHYNSKNNEDKLREEKDEDKRNGNGVKKDDAERCRRAIERYCEEKEKVEETTKGSGNDRLTKRPKAPDNPKRPPKKPSWLQAFWPASQQVQSTNIKDVLAGAVTSISTTRRRHRDMLRAVRDDRFRSLSAERREQRDKVRDERIQMIRNRRRLRRLDADELRNRRRALIREQRKAVARGTASATSLAQSSQPQTNDETQERQQKEEIAVARSDDGDAKKRKEPCPESVVFDVGVSDSSPTKRLKVDEEQVKHSNTSALCVEGVGAQAGDAADGAAPPPPSSPSRCLTCGEESSLSNSFHCAVCLGALSEIARAPYNETNQRRECSPTCEAVPASESALVVLDPLAPRIEDGKTRAYSEQLDDPFEPTPIAEIMKRDPFEPTPIAEIMKREQLRNAARNNNNINVVMAQDDPFAPMPVAEIKEAAGMNQHEVEAAPKATPALGTPHCRPTGSSTPASDELRPITSESTPVKPSGDKVGTIIPAQQCKNTSHRSQKGETKKEKERFLKLSRVLMKHLLNEDPDAYAAAKAAIKDCCERKQRQEPGYESLTASMKQRLKAVVEDGHWKRAESIHLAEERGNKAVLEAITERTAPKPTDIDNTGAIPLADEERNRAVLDGALEDPTALMPVDVDKTVEGQECRSAEGDTNGHGELVPVGNRHLIPIWRRPHVFVSLSAFALVLIVLAWIKLLGLYGTALADVFVSPFPTKHKWDALSQCDINARLVSHGMNSQWGGTVDDKDDFMVHSILESLAPKGEEVCEGGVKDAKALVGFFAATGLDRLSEQGISVPSAHLMERCTDPHAASQCAHEILHGLRILGLSVGNICRSNRDLGNKLPACYVDLADYDLGVLSLGAAKKVSCLVELACDVARDECTKGIMALDGCLRSPHGVASTTCPNVQERCGEGHAVFAVSGLVDSCLDVILNDGEEDSIDDIATGVRDRLEMCTGAVEEATSNV